VTRASLAQRVLSAAQPPLGARATGAQHLRPAAASFRPTTAHLAELEKTDLHALLTVIHAHRAIHATVAHLVVGKIAPHAMAQLLVASKTVRHALSIVMLDQLASSKTDHNVIRTSLVQPVLSEAQPLLGTRVTHAQRATHAMEAHVRHLALSTEQTHAGHASSMTAHASLTATTATTAPTVVQIVLTA